MYGKYLLETGSQTRGVELHSTKLTLHAMQGEIVQVLLTYPRL